MHTTPRQLLAVELEHFKHLTADERARVARLVTSTNCTITLAIAAVEANRRTVGQESKEYEHS